jgi:hypothetical protein
VIAGTSPRAEREWPGKALRIGDAVIGVHSLRPRCIVTTIDPTSGAQDLNVLRRIRREFDGSLALNCWVIAGGGVRVGDPAEVVPLSQGMSAEVVARPGGWVTGMPYPALIAGGSTTTPSRSTRLRRATPSSAASSRPSP